LRSCGIGEIVTGRIVCRNIFIETRLGGKERGGVRTPALPCNTPHTWPPRRPTSTRRESCIPARCRRRSATSPS
jgi:hypothetical protein